MREGPQLNIEKESEEKKAEFYKQGKIALSAIAAALISLGVYKSYENGFKEGSDEQKSMDDQKIVALEHSLKDAQADLVSALGKEAAHSADNILDNHSTNAVPADYGTTNYTYPKHKMTPEEKQVDKEEIKRDGPLPQ